MKVENDRRGAVLDEAVLKCLKLKKKKTHYFWKQEVAKKHTEKSHALIPHLPQC